jgi:hypothetical protein
MPVGQEARITAGNPTRAAEISAWMDTGDTQPGAGVSFPAADRDHDGGRLDAAAGCEYVDDRIRLPE